MRSNRCFFVSIAAIAAVSALTGCTVYTRPPEVSATVGVATDTGTGSREVTDHRAPDSDAMSTFRSALSPYGQWVDAPVCGRRFGPVWRPDPRVVGRDFVPYQTNGHWIATDAGWVFESDWDWGWAPFHYGRWCSDPARGWVWIPGTHWASAWVDWRMGGGYVGWAPLPPPGIAISADAFFFVETPHFAERRVTRHGIPPERRPTAIRATRPVDNVIDHRTYKAPAGPSVSQVRRADGSEVRPAHVEPPARGSVRRVTIHPR